MTASRTAVALTAAAILLAGCTSDAKPQAAATSGWVDAWESAPVGPLPRGCGAPSVVPAFPSQRATAQSVRLTVRPSIPGSAIRIRLSNRFGDRDVKLAHVTVARPGVRAAVTAGTTRDARFGGARRVTIPVGGEVVSDAIDVPVDADQPVAVSIAIESSGKLTWHVAGPAAYATRSGAGDRAGDTSGAAYRIYLPSYVLLTGLQVRAKPAVGAIVALGDSLTDGGGASLGDHWLQILGTRLRAAGRPHALVNAGVACNALTIASANGGVRASERLQVDVLDRAGVSDVLVFEGTNDIYGGVSAAVVIDALTALVARIHRAGHRVIGATLIPRGSPSPRDAERQRLNDWIRTTDLYDGVIDFDAVIRSSSDPNRMNPAYRGDDIHPNIAGHKAMGNAINLDLFGRPPRSPS